MDITFYSLTGGLIALIIAALVFSFLSVVVGYFVKLLLNEKAWGTKLFDHYAILAKVLDIVAYSAQGKTLSVGSCVKVRGYKCKLKHHSSSNSYYFHRFITEVYGEDKYGAGMKDVYYSDLDKGVGFKTLEEVTKTVEDKGLEVLRWQFPPSSYVVLKLLMAAVVLDALQVWFIMHPSTAFIGIPLIATMFSVRWLSGKLANVAKRTGKSEERLDKIEERHNEEQK